MSILRFEVHHDGKTLNVVSIFEAEAPARAKAQQMVSPGIEVICEPIEAPNGKALWLVASRKTVPRLDVTRFPSNLHEPYWIAASFAEKIFRSIETQAIHRGYGFHWYKNFEPDHLRTVFANTNWNQTVGEIASSLLSRLIVKHPFPNGNHRTSLAITSSFLASCGIVWPHYGIDAERSITRLYGESYSFFVESKYILQLLRRRPLFRVAIENGFKRFHIGEDRIVKAKLTDCQASDKDLHRMHLAAAQKLVTKLTSRKDRSLLDETVTPMPTAWLDFLQSG